MELTLYGPYSMIRPVAERILVRIHGFESEAAYRDCDSELSQGSLNRSS